MVRLVTKILGLGLVAALFFVMGQRYETKNFPISTEEFPKDPMQELIRTMSLEQKVGQMFMVGIFVQDVETWKEEFLGKMNIGGVILHPYNIESEDQVRALTQSLQEGVLRKDVPLFIAVNQEGGEIVSVKFVKEMQGGRQIHDEDTAFKVGFARAKELRGLGINVNFTPVVDVVEETNSFLYSRSFSADPQEVARFALAYVKGQREGGILSCAKHFPGHGISLGDSHINIPISSASFAELEPHLFPFRFLAKEVDMVMTTHMLFPDIDTSIVPFSSFFLEDILRSQLGFQGVIITDDIEMKAVRNIMSVPEAVVAAVKAGVDIATISGALNSQRAGYQALLEAVQSGEVSEERINQSVGRILRAKGNLTW